MFESNLPLPGRRRGKVRDVYTIPGGYAPPPNAGPEGPGIRPVPALLIVASDRVSAFDVVMPTPIPGKGRLLTDIAARWFRFIEQRRICSTHLLSTDAADIPGLTPDQRASLDGRVTIGRACRVVPIECVVRGYLAGSGYADYQRSGAICGVALPPGLLRGQSLINAAGGPIFTPATKAQSGHDENITFAQACAAVGEHTMLRLRDLSTRIYLAAHDHALARGVILADTKFEFGVPVDEQGEPDSDQLTLVDEALTPDSSRYWPAENYTPGREQQSFDKQPLRDHLEGLVAQGRWDKSPPGPPLPPDVAAATIARYEEARRRLFGA